MMKADLAKQDFFCTGCGNHEVNVQEGFIPCLQVKRKCCDVLELIVFSPVFAAG
jgi:hypothetical protein